jgi:hypothetical protein
MADAAAAALQAQITATVTAALAAQAAAAALVAHVAVKLPDFWVKDPKMWFSQAEAQFCCARITAETTMYDYVLMKLPEDVVMSVRSLVSAIEADPVKQEESYTLMKQALLGSCGKTKWQMAYALLDHPELGNRRPPAMMAEMLALRYETTAPDWLIFSGTPGTPHRFPLCRIHWPPFPSVPLRLRAAALLTAAPGRPIAAAVANANRPAALHLDARMARSCV